MDEAARAQLAGKHPPQQVPTLPEAPAYPELPAQLRDDAALLAFARAVIDKANQEASPGADGLTFRDLKAVFSDEEQASQAIRWLRDAVEGRLSNYHELATGRLVGIGKNDAGDLRPICVNSALYRLVAGMAYRIAIDHDKVAESECMLQQFALHVKDGAPLTAHAVRLALDAGRQSNPTAAHIVVNLDCKNAFNTGSRTAMLRNWATLAPLSYRMMAPLYAAHSPLIVHGSDGQVYGITSQAGQRQGDNTGTLGFCLLAEPALLSIRRSFLDRGVTIVSYADDITIVGPADSALDAAAAVKCALSAACGLSLSEGKCSLHAAAEDMAEAACALAKRAALAPFFSDQPTALATVIGCPVSLSRADSQEATDTCISHIMSRIYRVARPDFRVLNDLAAFNDPAMAMFYFNRVVKSQFIFDIRTLMGFGESKHLGLQLIELFLKTTLLRITKFPLPIWTAEEASPVLDALLRLGDPGAALAAHLGFAKDTATDSWRCTLRLPEGVDGSLVNQILHLRFRQGGMDATSAAHMAVMSSEAFFSSTMALLGGQHDIGEREDPDRHPASLSALARAAVFAESSPWREDARAASLAEAARANALLSMLDRATELEILIKSVSGLLPHATLFRDDGILCPTEIAKATRRRDDAMQRATKPLKELLTPAQDSPQGPKAAHMDSNLVREINHLDFLVVVADLVVQARKAAYGDDGEKLGWLTSALAWLITSQGKTAGVWVANPHVNRSLRLSPSAWSHALRARLLCPSPRLILAPLAGNPSIPCHCRRFRRRNEHVIDTADLHADNVLAHCIGCKARGNNTTATHNSVVRCLRNMAARAGFLVTIEPPSHNGKSFQQSKRPDLRLEKDGRLLYVDVVVTNPAASSYRAHACLNADAAVLSAEQTKLNQYAGHDTTRQLLQNGQIIPFALTATGRIGPKGCRLMADVMTAKLANNNSADAREKWHHWWANSISCSLTSGISKQFDNMAHFLHNETQATARRQADGADRRKLRHPRPDTRPPHASAPFPSKPSASAKRRARRRRAHLRKANAGSPSNQAQQTSAKPRRKRRLSPDRRRRARLHGSSPPPIHLDAPPSLAPDAAQPPLPGLDGLLPPSLLQGW